MFRNTTLIVTALFVAACSDTANENPGEPTSILDNNTPERLAEYSDAVAQDFVESAGLYNVSVIAHRWGQVQPPSACYENWYDRLEPKLPRERAEECELWTQDLSALFDAYAIDVAPLAFKSEWLKTELTDNPSIDAEFRERMDARMKDRSALETSCSDQPQIKSWKPIVLTGTASTVNCDRDINFPPN